MSLKSSCSIRSSRGGPSPGGSVPCSGADGDGSAAAGVGSRVLPRALGQRLCLPRADSPSRSSAGDLVELDRPDVDAVDGGHRRDVAGAEALEVADVDVGVLAVSCLDRGEQLVGPAQRARDVRADVDVVAADGPRVELVVEGGDGDDVARRQAHDRRDLLIARGEHQP